MAKETAEEKLLKIMNKSAGIPIAKKTAAAAPAKKKFTIALSMQQLNLALLAGIAVCVSLLAWELYSGLALVRTDVDLADDVRTPAGIAQVALPSGADVSVYLNKVKARNIFRPFDGQAQASSASSQGLSARMAKYRLVGVAWLDLPETASVMIEDTESKTTYFLKAGEQLEGVTIKTIYTDRAVLGDENEETIIKL